MAKLIQLFYFRLEKGHGLNQYTVFRKAYILSGSGFHEFLYSIIEIREIAEFIPNQLKCG